MHRGTDKSSCFLPLQKWHCDFCGTRNEVNITLEEVPMEEDTTFVMSPPTHAEEDLTRITIGADATLVFCLDTSGSMCTTTEVR